jgi:hypothetical protein
MIWYGIITLNMPQHGSVMMVSISKEQKYIVLKRQNEPAIMEA